MTLKQKIQSLLTAANTKTEAGDTDLTGAVKTLIDGYGGGEDAGWQYIKSAHYMFAKVNSSGAWSGRAPVLPDEFRVPEMPMCIYAERMFAGNGSIGSRLVLGGFSQEGVNLNAAFRGVYLSTSTPHEIVLEKDIFPTTMGSIFQETSLGTLDKPLSFTGQGRFDCRYCTSFTFGGGGRIDRMLFVENTISANFSVSSLQDLNDLSIISIANGFNEAVTATATFSTAQKSKLNTILGTVSLDPTETFHIFTEDASGTVTLADFITNVKGWTIA